jgi:hypothetical protein
MDTRVFYIFQEEMRGDKSFMEKPGFLEGLFGKSITNADLRDAWDKGIRHGIAIGLRRASVEGQRIELNEGTLNTKHREYLQKSWKLAEEYECAIQYHPLHGMMVIDRKPQFDF